MTIADDGTRVGAVLVVGGGIAGMQASLDLAESGIKVYLVEATTTIGGKMAQLDKTFPTTDCAMCTISPKLAECGRNLNIDILSNSEVLSLEGEPGNFKATVVRRARYVDLEKCTSCGQCAEVCPIKVTNSFNEGLNDRRAIYKMYPQGVPNAYAITKKGRSPCKATCPAGTSVQGYVALIREGRYADALRVNKQVNPFPSICGRICAHPCEAQCNRGLVDKPIAISALKRFVAERGAADLPKPEPVEKTRKERIAIVGSGPAGMAAAQDLAMKGYAVKVFEALPVAGGMMRVGIPEHRLPRDVIQREIDDILALGVEMQTNTRVERPASLLKEGFDAVFVAVGAHKDRTLNLDGEDLDGVHTATRFLREVALGARPDWKGTSVVVIGGGNTGLDVGRTALRLGAKKIHVMDILPADKVPANPWEIEEALAEGITTSYLETSSRIVGKDGKVAGLQCHKINWSEPDASGRRTPIKIEGSDFTIDADKVVIAIGQAPDLSADLADDGVNVSKRGTIETNPDTMMTSVPGVFAGGTVVTAAGIVIEAIASGHRAAEAIDAYLSGQEIKKVEQPTAEVVRFTEDEIRAGLLDGTIVHAQRAVAGNISMDRRLTTFDEVELTLTEEQAKAEAERCLSCGICSECYECERVCQAGAVNHKDQDKVETLNVGAVIMATGYDLYDPSLKEEYGFGRYPNVVTAMQFERILSASGPTSGHIDRPSDGQTPQRIAWFQCIGSRDQEHNYCSSVCCMYAAKEAMLAKEHAPGVECQVFMMDERAFSKGYTAFYERAKVRSGVNFTRCRVSMLKEDPATKDLIVRYENEDGEFREERFGMVVLSVGMEASAKGRELADRLGVNVNGHGFADISALDPVSTSREGVYVCGAFSGPKDIPESVIQGSGAAAKALALLKDVRGTEVREMEYPDERAVAGEDPRVGVFICHCGSNIAGVIDVAGVEEYTKGLHGVAHAQRFLYTCSEDSLRTIKEKADELKLNRVIVASCTPRTHEPIFRDTIRQVGLNPYLFEMANIRDQCSWVHGDNHDAATDKAKDLVRMAVSRAKTLEPLHKISQPIDHAALVIGGGVAGMTAALDLADSGFQVYLVEREEQLGGRFRDNYYLLDGSDPQHYLRSVVERVEGHERISVYKGTEVSQSGGFVGNFKSTLVRKWDNGDGFEREFEIKHGVTIVATGGEEHRTSDYMLGQDARVMTQLGLEKTAATKPEEITKARSIVMIQCAGREELGYCSRTCCLDGIKNAIKVKELNPRASVYMLYKDIMTYGTYEQYYTEARRKGVVLVRYTDDSKPVIGDRGMQLSVQVYDPIMRESLTLLADKLVLSTGVVPDADNRKLANMMRLPLSTDGFLLEAHVKLRPVEFATEGAFLAGTAHYPKLVEESIGQALAAAARSATILSQDELQVGGIVAQVDPEKCAACLTCVRTCPYKVPFINSEGYAQIEMAACQGCGTCAAECPGKAIQLAHYRDGQLLAKTEVLVEEELVVSR